MIHHTSTINFYYVGRINYVKGIHVLLKAFSSIDNQNIKLHLIGGTANDSERRYMRRLQRQYKRDNRIIWHGKLSYEHMIESIKDFHCLIHPTICLEAFGLDIAEALQQNKYVIATQCGGAEMQIKSNNEGILVNPNDVNAMVQAIDKYINNPISAKTKVRSIAEHVEELIDLYKRII
ncbi:MAG: glycosyltransferase family 4 protein [Bacteroidales bacterium]|nr:glycosyltransferase family 4 protein [Bacteroidales bacterium]